MWFLANWRLAAMGAVVLSLVGFLWSWDSRGERIDDLEREAAGWNNAIAGFEIAAKQNDAEIAECKAVNLANAAEADKQREAARQALANVEVMRQRMTATIEGLRNESESMRGRDTECRTLDGDLPGWFVDGMRE
jgi:hypothetical protein